jgi:hypothetical protein
MQTPYLAEIQKYVRLLLVLYLPALLAAQEIALPDETIEELGGGWYLATAVVTGHADLTPAAAYRRAEEQALRRITEYHGGVQVTNAAVSLQAEGSEANAVDRFSQVTSSLTRGLIIEKEVRGRQPFMVDGQPHYAVTVKARAGRLEGEADPFFRLHAALNRSHFRDGDDMIITISSSRDCYLFVFNVLADETVSALLPNRYLPGNFLAAGDTLRLPPANGPVTRFRVGLTPGTNEAAELVMILAVNAGAAGNQHRFELNPLPYHTVLSAVMEFILRFPRGDVEQRNLPYWIH